LRERLEQLRNAAPVNPSDVEAIYQDTVWTTARDITKLALHVALPVNQGGQAYSFTPDAQQALNYMTSWVSAAGLDGTNSYSALAARVNAAFESIVSAKTALFGTAEEGRNFWLRCKVARLESNPPCADCPPNTTECTDDLTSYELAFLDQALCGAWASIQQDVCPTVAGCTLPTTGCPGDCDLDDEGCEICSCLNGNTYDGTDVHAYFDNWYSTKRLSGKILRWTFPLTGLPRLVTGTGSTISFGPVLATSAGTLLSQRSQTYSQAVRLGPSTTSPDHTQSWSLCPIGQQEREGTNYPHFADQQDEWEAGTLKASSGLAPTTCTSACSGVGTTCCTTTLSYP
jgi:hypothetical protein